jgi:predicted nucleotidyltransferase
MRYAPCVTVASLPPRIAAAIADVKSRLVDLFGARFVSVTLFGSWAWGRTHADSDVDLCIVVDGLTHREHVEIVEVVADRAIELGVDLAPIVWSRERVARGLATEQRLVRDIVQNGVVL